MLTTMTTRAAVAAVATGLLWAGFAATAEAKIEPQVGIGGIELEMTVAKVMKKKGKPDRDRVVSDEDVGEQRELRYGKTTALFAGAGDDAPLIGVITKSRRERTDGGSGVGTKEEKLREDLRRLRCRMIAGERHCLLGRLRNGRTVTDFVISDRTGRVTRVTVAIITD